MNPDTDEACLTEVLRETYNSPYAVTKEELPVLY